MPRISNAALFLTVLLSLAGFTLFRSGWIPVEVGGAATGSVLKQDASSTHVSSAAELDADDAPLFEVGGAPSEMIAGETEPLDEPEATNTDSIQLVAQVEPRVAKKAELPAEAETDNEPTAEPPVRIAERAKNQLPMFDFTEIDRQIKAGQVVEAHQALSKLFWQRHELRSSVQERIDVTAKAIYFSPQLHVQEPYVAQAGDQLRKIAVKHHVSWQYLSRLNRLDPKRLREGQKLKVIDGPFGAVVTLSDFELTLHHNGQYVRSYPCCIGKNNSTPVGKFKVLNKVTKPQYTDPDGKVFAGDDPKNPLGTHWIDLGDSYGIHGTIEPDSIGKAESRGCIRLLNGDVAEVYDLLDLASEVVIRP